MRLLNATSLKFRDYPDESRFPPYVILSHTWDDKQEVTLRDMASPYLTDKEGYSKITNTCRLARERGIEWVWIDTCCIDKTNNTELTESINSMFRWYKLAEVCIVHLVDFTKTPQPDISVYAPGDLSCGLLTPQDSENIVKCAWFHRGWTLQELLAPAQVEFYDTAWTHIGSKARLCPLVSHITRIPENAIQGTIDLAVYSTAQRMAWASSRVTTKIEDAAYSLLGLFDVNMPLIYGEGHRAFQRLQEEILKISTDFTLFGWAPSEGEDQKQQRPGNNTNTGTTTPCMPLLASSPRQFQECYELEQFRNDDSEFSITNRGLRLTAYLVLIPLDSSTTERSRNSVVGRPSPERLPHRSVTVPQHQPSLSLPGIAPGVGLGLSDHSHSSSSPALSTATSSGSIRQKAAAISLPRQHRYRYVLTIGKRRTDRPDRTDKTKRGIDSDEIGICLRKTGPGQLIREGNQPLEEMSRVELRNVLNTTEAHTFYITLRPNGLGNTIIQPPPVAALYSATTVADSLSDPSPTPVLRGHTPPAPHDARFGASAQPPHPALHLWTQTPSGTPVTNILDSSDWRNSPTTGIMSPQTPPLSSAVSLSQNTNSNLNQNAASILKYSDLSSHHPLRMFYHPRLLRGMYIPSLIDRGIVFGNFPQQPFDERLRIFCLPESASEVIAFSCKSRQGKDELSFSVLVDFRHGRSHPQCKVVDRSSIQSQFFFALSMRSQMEPMRWYMVDNELPEISTSTNRLRIKPAHSERTYEIVAAADNGAVPIDNYTLLMPTLDIKITNVTGSTR
ncbi:het domain-containing protein [Ophiostoma piceae UAMH 11346]|uniref:Het domain-containing protein n=1 Tax=Ophiostoma piceae (strain UAMH 11346) TaxID=1262450 RepID=S3BND8_OPHP1|nr:het domain-containing protein [Ophiostoma piceae UAMH 11346]